MLGALVLTLGLASAALEAPISLGLMYLIYKSDPTIFWISIAVVVIFAGCRIYAEKPQRKETSVRLYPVTAGPTFTPFDLRIRQQVIPVSQMCDMKYTISDGQGLPIYYIEPDANKIQHIYDVSGEIGHFNYSPKEHLCTFYSNSNKVQWFVNKRGEVFDAKGNDLGCFDERLK